jgi:hypothetical protein
VKQVSISAGNRGVLSGIGDGSYNLFFAFFDEYQQIIARQRFETTLNFYTSPTERGIQYEKYNVTLTPVAGGNARTTTVPERDFP